MRLLFVHQNFPGQYRHLAEHYAAAGHEVVAIGEVANVKRNAPLPGVRLFGYENKEKPSVGFNASVLQASARGRAVAAACLRLRKAGFSPDVVFAHIGWGEALFLKDVFPDARIVLYCEYFYRSRGGDVGFDPGYPATAEQMLRLRVMNAPLLMSLDASDVGLAPTRWQWSRFPAPQRPRIAVIHDGIDTDLLCPSGSTEPELITYVARNLEPYRGFHVFMRAIPEIQRRRPRARIVVVGGEDVSYSPRLPAGETYKKRLLKELAGKIDLSRIHFTGRIPYAQYLDLLRRSAAHVYLTYPFVLSWSMLEAMSAGCLVIGSRTAPVEEVICDGENGLLVDFFDREALAARIDEALSLDSKPLRAAARRTVIQRYDLKSICLPAQERLVERLLSPPAKRAA
jgi:glycosyltransferase involved in cell wall biosynthesis